MAGTAAVAATAPAAATAQAALSIAPVKACYVSGEPVTVTGTGFTPSGQVSMTFDSTSLGLFAADAAGGVTLSGGINQMRGVKTHAITATDQANPALTATASFFGTTLTATFKPKEGRAGISRRIKGYGFVAGPRVFLHVRGPGYKADRRIAKAKGPCGTFTVRTTLVPTGARSGSYTIQLDAKKRFSRKTRPAVRTTLTVFRTASASSARASVARASAAGAGQSWSLVNH